MAAIRVLLADDETAYTDAVRKVLTRRGMSVVVKADADSAVEAIQTQPFDVVLLDVKMPGKSGIAALTEIRQIAPDLPVILLTGHLAVEDERQGLSAGATAYLLKPHPFPDLVARIEAAAGRKCQPG